MKILKFLWKYKIGSVFGFVLALHVLRVALLWHFDSLTDKVFLLLVHTPGVYLFYSALYDLLEIPNLFLFMITHSIGADILNSYGVQDVLFILVTSIFYIVIGTFLGASLEFSIRKVLLHRKIKVK